MTHIMKAIKGVSAKKTYYLKEETSIAQFSKSRYGSSHITHINKLYFKVF
jgi:hypothetical protein